MSRIPSGPVFNMGDRDAERGKENLQILGKTDVAYSDDKPGTFYRGENDAHDSIGSFPLRKATSDGNPGFDGTPAPYPGMVAEHIPARAKPLAGHGESI